MRRPIAFNNHTLPRLPEVYRMPIPPYFGPAAVVSHHSQGTRNTHAQSMPRRERELKGERTQVSVASVPVLWFSSYYHSLSQFVCLFVYMVDNGAFTKFWSKF